MPDGASYRTRTALSLPSTPVPVPRTCSAQQQMRHGGGMRQQQTHPSGSTESRPPLAVRRSVRPWKLDETQALLSGGGGGAGAAAASSALVVPPIFTWQGRAVGACAPQEEQKCTPLAI